MFRRLGNRMTVAGWLTLVMLVLPTSPLPAQAAISDPTRPPMLKKKAAKVVAPKPVHREIEKKAPEVYVLTSTLVSRERTIATINGHVVAVGDKVGSATVVAIESAQVNLRQGSQVLTLMLAAQKVKKLIRGQAVMNQQRLP